MVFFAKFKTYSSSTHNQDKVLFQLTLIVEAVDAIDGGTLMVPPEQEEVFWVFDLVGEQQADGFQRLLPSVYVIPQKQIVGLWREAAILE